MSGRVSPSELELSKLTELPIFFIRGHRVMLGPDLASLYNVPTFRLNEQVKRNIKRFPVDFMFQLTSEETITLTSQIAISKRSRGGRRVPPYAFTEQGVAMLSSVLNSERAIQVNIEIMRAFVRMRSILAANRELAKRLEKLEKTTTLNFVEIYRFIDDYRKANRQLPSAIGFRHFTPKK